MGGNERNKIEFEVNELDVTNSYLEILKDEMLDRIFPGLETNTGKKRREIENLIIQANIALYEHIIISTIHYFLNKIKNENNDMLTFELTHKYKIDETTRHFIHQLYHEQRIFEAKRFELVKQLEKATQFFQEKIQQLSIKVNELDQFIQKYREKITNLDNEIVRIDKDMKDIYMKHYDSILAKPILPIQLTGFVSELNLPASHLLNSVSDTINIDVVPIVKARQEATLQSSFDINHIDQDEIFEIKKQIDSQLRNFFQKYTSENESIAYTDRVKKLSCYEKCEAQIKQIFADMNLGFIEKINENKAERIKKIDLQKECKNKHTELEIQKNDFLDQISQCNDKIELTHNVIELLSDSSSLTNINQLDMSNILNLESTTSKSTELGDTPSFSKNHHGLFASHVKNDLDNLFEDPKLDPHKKLK